jgi:hypothetical protein
MQRQAEIAERQQFVKKFYSERREAGLKIDPATAEIFWHWAQILDPYGIDPDMPKENSCIGRVYFARSPESEGWVEFGDLPDATETKLWERLRNSDGADGDVLLPL